MTTAIQEPTLRFPSSLSHRERELWEREAASLGYFTEDAQKVAERHPIEEGEGQKLYRKRIETIRRAEAAIEDGRKEEPAQNARTHGFTAKTFRLAPGEREEDYQVRISDSLKRHQPQDSEELDQVVIIVNATWQLLRIQCAASDLMCLNYEEGTTASDALLLHNGTDFNSLSRYEGTQNRTLDKARKRLNELKQERGAAVPAASSPVSHQRPAGDEEITERTREMAEDSSSPFPGRERAGVRDGSTDHASEETTKSERSGDLGERSESGRTPEEDPAEPSRPSSENNNYQTTSEHAADSHANNRQLTLQQPEHPSRLSDPEMRELCIRAHAFLTADRRFHTIGDVRLVWGIQGLALCLAYAASGEEARWLWVVVGDLPPAHLPTGPCPTAEEALKEYADQLRAWLEAAQQGEPSNEYIPMLHPVTFNRLKPTAEARTFIENRARFINEKIIQNHGEELRAIGVRPGNRARES